jgi:multiple sugar transport system ATP-binding protein
MAKVVLKQLAKEFEIGNPIVKQIDLTVEDGEFMVLVGPSGCGKTTILRLIAGLEEPTGGEIYIGDQLVNGMPPKERDVAMVFQNYALYPHMTVYENMAFGLKLRRIPKAEIADRVREAAALLELEQLLDRKPRQLSGGQRQRVALGRALVRKPQVFLFDEPLSNLDAKLRVQMRTEIKKLHQRLQATMIYVTHDQIEAMTMGDRIAVLKAGIIHQIDTPTWIYQHPADLFVAGFIGSPAMNFIEMTIQDHEGLYAVRNAMRLPIPEHLKSAAQAYSGKKVTVGIRPEDLHLIGPASPRADHEERVLLRFEVSEPMGSETFIYLTTPDGVKLICRIPTMIEKIAPGANLEIHFDCNHLHLFDPATQRRIAET